MTKKRVLITGITGMVGSHLTDFLLAETDWEVYGMCRWRSPIDNLSHLIERINKKDRVHLLYGDLRDYISVHDVMKHLNWTWYPKGIPTVDDITFSARERIETVIKNCLLDAKPDEEYFVSSGGLKATSIKNNYGQITFLELEFVVTSWDLNDPYDVI